MFFNIHYFIVYVFISLSIDCFLFFQILFEIAGKKEYFCLRPPCHIVGRCSNFRLLFPILRFEPANLKIKSQVE